MSGYNDKDDLLEGKAAGEDGNLDGLMAADHFGDTSPPAEIADEEDAPAFSGPVDAANVEDYADQVSSSPLLDHADQINGVPVIIDHLMGEDKYFIKVSEDGGKEDMFVDCPDELISIDGRTSDDKEVKETKGTVEEKVDTLNAHFNNSNYRIYDRDAIGEGELESMQAKLQITVAEKDSISREYEEEQMTLRREIANLQRQLKALNEQPLSLSESNSVLIAHLNGTAVIDNEDTAPTVNLSLHEMIRECYNHLQKAFDEKSQTEGALSELQTILHVKNQEVEKLNEKLDQEQHIDAIVSRMLTSLAAVISEEELLDGSLIGKIMCLEKIASFLVEKYYWFFSEINLLSQCLNHVNSNLSMQNEMEVFVSARNNLLGLKSKEIDLNQRLSQLGEQLDRHNSEVLKLNVELEQEKVKYTNTKEKLSLAVTKGKALIQQRDSLKQSLADKTIELEKCLIELQQKSASLVSAELTKEELVKSENMISSLQEILKQKDMIFQKCEEIMSQIGATEIHQSTDIVDRVTWLAHQWKMLSDASVEYHKLRDILLSPELPETVLSSELESRVTWLLETFALAKDEAIKLQGKLARMREAANNEIDQLTASFLVETLEKHYLQGELGDFTCKYEEIVGKENQLLVENKQTASMLLEASGISMDSESDIYHSHSDIALVIDRCIRKIKEQSSTYLESSYVETEVFQRFQCLLYVRHLDSVLYEEILEEDMLDRTKMNFLSNELSLVSQEICALKDEKDFLQTDLGRSEEKTALLREKLSMAVKKGKGLVQERDNLKKVVEEKKCEIEKLKVEIQQQESAFQNRKDQITKLLTDIEQIPKLKADLAVMQNKKDQVEQFLAESNSMLQRLIEAIDNISLPFDSDVGEPVEKVKWVAEYFSECQVARAEADEQLERVKDEASTLINKLAEAQMTINSLEDALSTTDNNVSQLAEEKKELEVSKAYIEQELQKVMEEASSQTSKLEEVCATTKLLENALSEAENKISVLNNEKDDAQFHRDVVARELQTVKEEVSAKTSKLSEACRTIQSLEEALSQVQTNVSLLSEENSNTQLDKTDLDNEVKRLTEEADAQASRLGDALLTIRSLEDEFKKTKDKVSDLSGEKKIAEEEIFSLNSKLKVCMQELEKVTDEASSQAKKFEDVCASRKSLQDALSLTKNKMSLLIDEKEDAQVHRVVAERELNTVKAEVSTHTSKLSEAYETIQCLEDALYQVQTNVSVLAEENRKAQVDKIELHNEVSRLKEDVDSQASRLADTLSTVKSLEEALTKAEDKISDLVGEKTIAEQEIVTLNSTLNACMLKLAGINDSIEDSSLKISGYLNGLQLFMKDQNLFPLLMQGFERKIGSLTQMDLLLKDMREHMIETDSKMLQNHSFTEEDCTLPNELPEWLSFAVDMEMINDEVTSDDRDSVALRIEKAVEKFCTRNKILTDKFEGLSSFMNELIAALSKKLLLTRDKVVFVLEQIKSLKQNLNFLETEKEAQENKIGLLENDVNVLLSACTDATQKLELEVENNVQELSSVPELEKLNLSLFSELRSSSEDAIAGSKFKHIDSKYVKIAGKLLVAATNIQNLRNHFLDSWNTISAKIEILQNNLEENYEKSIWEMDQNKKKVFKLENDLEAFENLFSEMRLKLEECRAKEDMLKERGISSITKEAENLFLSASQNKSLFDKIRRIDIPSGFKEGNLEPSDLVYFRKLCYVVDTYTELQYQTILLSNDKEKLQSTIATQAFEIDHLKDQVEKHIIDKKDTHKMKDQLLELGVGLENVIKKLGGDELVGVQISAGAAELLPTLEKMVMAMIVESENFKSKAQELGAKLLGAQKVADESNKVKLLEDSSQSKIASPESVPSRSEISEFHDAGPVGKSISPSTSTAFVRTLRKGSSDHLAINIDSESSRFISNMQTDDEKGHIFKSLNTSGVIPRQGKMIADRIDGIWVSGDRALMSRPRVRLSLIIYSVLLHLWLLGTIL